MRSGRSWPRAAAAAVALALLGAMVTGCKDEPDATAQDPPTEGKPAWTQDVAVLRAWADTMRAGRVAAASRLFSVPSLAQNYSPPLALRTRAAVHAFNASLPCGARLLDARREGHYTVGRFLLTDRPGGGCGQGTGHVAAAAFRLRAGKIVEWRRVPIPRRAAPAPRPRPDGRV